jgi:hypothetical protein
VFTIVIYIHIYTCTNIVVVFHCATMFILSLQCSMDKKTELLLKLDAVEKNNDDEKNNVLIDHLKKSIEMIDKEVASTEDGMKNLEQDIEVQKKGSQGIEVMTNISANQAKKRPAEGTVITAYNQGKMSKNHEEAVKEQVEKASTTSLDVGESTVTVLEVEGENEA